MSYSNCCKTAVSVLKTIPVAVNNHQLRCIKATDYKPLDIPEPHLPCHCCGMKGSWYVEKLTAERRARPKDDQTARRVCRKCYDAVVRWFRALALSLPGMIDFIGMEPTFSEYREVQQ